MGERLKCGFCGKETEPRRVDKDKVVIFYCKECGSVTAAYLREFEDLLRFGKLFEKFPLNHFKPKPPSFIKTTR